MPPLHSIKLIKLHLLSEAPGQGGWMFLTFPVIDDATVNNTAEIVVFF